jgi:hypothetical protein
MIKEKARAYIGKRISKQGEKEKQASEAKQEIRRPKSEFRQRKGRGDAYRCRDSREQGESKINMKEGTTEKKEKRETKIQSRGAV